MAGPDDSRFPLPIGRIAYLIGRPEPILEFFNQQVIVGRDVGSHFAPFEVGTLGCPKALGLTVSAAI